MPIVVQLLPAIGFASERYIAASFAALYQVGTANANVGYPLKVTVEDAVTHKNAPLVPGGDDAIAAPRGALAAPIVDATTVVKVALPLVVAGNETVPFVSGSGCSCCFEAETVLDLAQRDGGGGEDLLQGDELIVGQHGEPVLGSTRSFD